MAYRWFASPDQRAYEPTHSCPRPNSDVVLLPRRTKFRNEVRQKHGRSTASESNFWIKFGTQLSLTSSAVLWHGSDSNVVLLPCQTKFINNINVFWRDCVPAGRIVTCTCLQQCSENPEFGMTLVQRLNQSRTSAVLQSNLIAIKFGAAEARRLNFPPPPTPRPYGTGQR